MWLGFISLCTYPNNAKPLVYKAPDLFRGILSLLLRLPLKQRHAEHTLNTRLYLGG
jgi:hypothetical protein